MRDADARLAAFADLVRTWGRRLDLVAPRDLDRFEARHVADCARAADLLDRAPAGPAVDVGSGAGLPGIVLAILRPERSWVLLEPRARRAGFLEEAVRALELDALVVPERAEAALRSGHAGRYAVATARALAPPAQAFRLVLPLLAPSGVAAVWVGESAEPVKNATEWTPGIATMIAPAGSPP